MLKADLQYFGGRGASSGRTYFYKGEWHVYGSEYHTILKESNIKFVVGKNDSATAPRETKTEGRIYVTVNKKNELKYITFYDKSGKKSKQVDLSGNAHIINGKKTLPHTHRGYNHEDVRNVTASEKAMVEKVKRIWNNYLSRER